MTLIKKIIAVSVSLILIISLCSCGKKAEAPAEDENDLNEMREEYPVIIGDIKINSRPGRIISLSPAITEKIYDLSLESRLVGVSNFCDYPEEVGDMPRCGTVQIPNFEEIEALSPGLIFIQGNMSESDLVRLQQMDIEIVKLDTAQSFEELYGLYTAIAKILEGDVTGGELGEELTYEFKSRLGGIKNSSDAIAGKYKVIYLRLLDFNMATGDTLENECLSALGLNNIAAGYDLWLYPEDEANSEEGKAAFKELDFIICDEDYVNIKMLEKSDFYKGLQATIKDRYFYIDSIAFERQSLRMLEELDRLRSDIIADSE